MHKQLITDCFSETDTLWNTWLVFLSGHRCKRGWLHKKTTLFSHKYATYTTAISAKLALQILKICVDFDEWYQN